MIYLYILALVLNWFSSPISFDILDCIFTLYIHPNIWHEGVFPIEEKSSFQGRQGKVHARVSIDLQKEFKKYIYFKTSF